jgi:hypothetical protein
MFDEATVKKYLSKVKESKSQGSDSIHPKLIKETVVSISKPVTKIFNKNVGIISQSGSFVKTL